MAYGTVNVDAMTTSDGYTSAGTYGFKNRIINGAMVIDQRNAGASGTGNSNYTVDRWYYYGSQASKGTWQQNAGSVTPPAGFTNYLGFTSSSAYSVSSTDVFMFYQVIEGYNIADLGWGTANAKTVTLSFWVRSSLTGTFGGALQGGGGSWSYPFSYTISSANTWTQVSVTIAGQTSGTWGATNGTGFIVRLSLGAGSTYTGTANAWSNSDLYGVTGQVNVVGTNGATFYITGVQLEKGSTATSFDYRPYGTELVLCYRYYYQIGSGGTNARYAVGGCSIWGSNSAQVTMPMATTMRSAPSVTFITAASSWTLNSGINAGVCSSLSTAATNPNMAWMQNATSAVLAAGTSANFYETDATGAAKIGFSSEL